MNETKQNPNKSGGYFFWSTNDMGDPVLKRARFVQDSDYDCGVYVILQIGPELEYKTLKYDVVFETEQEALAFACR